MRDLMYKPITLHIECHPLRMAKFFELNDRLLARLGSGLDPEVYTFLTGIHDIQGPFVHGPDLLRSGKVLAYVDSEDEEEA